METRTGSSQSLRETTLKVATLLCHKHMEFALPCIQSWIANTPSPLAIRVYDDGSLTPEDIEQLHSLGSAITVLDFPTVAQLTREKLRPFPLCQEYFNHQAMGIKLFSIPLLEGPQPILYLDSDVFAFESLNTLVQGISPEVRNDRFAVFQRDAWCAYAFPGNYYLQRQSPRPLERCCAGMMFYSPAILDLPLCEQLLPLFPKPHFHANEQTLWAILASNSRAFHWDSSRVSLSLMRCKNPGFIHYVTSTRHRIPEASPLLPERGPVGLFPARIMTFASFAWYRVKRALHGRLNALAIKIRSRQGALRKPCWS